MRVFLPPMILSLAAMSWLAGAAAPAAAGAPADPQVYEPLAFEGQGQDTGQSPYADPASTILGLLAPDDCGPRWIVAAEVVAIERLPPRSQRLFVGPPGTRGIEPIDAQNMDFDVALGPKISAVRRGPCGWELEVAYFQVDGSTAQATIPGEWVMVTDANIGFTVANPQFRDTSAVYWGELNVRRQCTDWLNVWVGLRVGEFDEHYRADGMGTSPLARVPVSVNYNTYNHLYGFQIGSDAEVYNMGGPLLVHMLCKAAILGNSANQNARRVQTGVSDESAEAQVGKTTFFGEAGVAATYALTCHLAFRVSAQATWLEGVAMVTDQIGTTDFTGISRVNANGSLFYYGGGLGFEYRY